MEQVSIVNRKAKIIRCILLGALFVNASISGQVPGDKFLEIACKSIVYGSSLFCAACSCRTYYMYRRAIATHIYLQLGQSNALGQRYIPEDDSKLLELREKRKSVWRDALYFQALCLGPYMFSKFIDALD